PVTMEDPVHAHPVPCPRSRRSAGGDATVGRRRRVDATLSSAERCRPLAAAASRLVRRRRSPAPTALGAGVALERPLEQPIVGGARPRLEPTPLAKRQAGLSGTAASSRLGDRAAAAPAVVPA